MKEDILHFVWRTKKFDLHKLETSIGEPIEILSFGQHNHDQGPDFSNARVKINETLWAGHIEMHIKSSDWYRHRHDTDLAYENVILHVVWEDDQPVTRKDGTMIPCLVLKQRVPHQLTYNYQYLQASETWIPCEKVIHNVDPLTVSSWLSRLAVERFVQKALTFESLMKETAQHVEESFYRALMSAFGLPQNKQPFEQLAAALPLSLIDKYSHDRTMLEALLFGQSGLLNSKVAQDLYAQELWQQYQYLMHKHSLQPLPMSLWKFGRMRPPSFPTVRLAQFAAIVADQPRLFAIISEMDSTDEIKKLLKKPVSPYWQKHYRFGDQGKGDTSTLGAATADIICINTILPFLFFYGKQRRIDTLTDKALSMLEELKPENNSSIKNWKKSGITAENAMESQALLQLKKIYCDQKKCLQCSIGAKIIQQKNIP